MIKKITTTINRKPVIDYIGACNRRIEVNGESPTSKELEYIYLAIICMVDKPVRMDDSTEFVAFVYDK